MMRWQIELEDWARASGLVRLALCEAKLHGKRRPAVNDHQALARHIVRLCEAARLATNESLMRNIERRIRECVRRLDVQQLNWGELIPRFDDPCIPKAAVLKPWVSAREKGVVLVNYESQYARLLRLPDLKGFAARYTLIVGPSWHPPHSLVNCVFAEAYRTRSSRSSATRGNWTFCLDYLQSLFRCRYTVPVGSIRPSTNRCRRPNAMSTF